MFLTGDPPNSSPLTLDDQKQLLLSALEAKRLARQNAGLQYTFTPAIPAVMDSDNVNVVTAAVPAAVGTIQTRDQTQYPDISNITGFTTAALILSAQGVTGSVIAFRDAENVTHQMTPTQMIAMGMAVQTFISSTYSAKWAIQNQIYALNSSNIGSFDITQGWPP